jgi:hypothetical protein
MGRLIETEYSKRSNRRDRLTCLSIMFPSCLPSSDSGKRRADALGASLEILCLADRGGVFSALAEITGAELETLLDRIGWLSPTEDWVVGENAGLATFSGPDTDASSIVPSSISISGSECIFC